MKRIFIFIFSIIVSFTALAQVTTSGKLLPYPTRAEVNAAFSTKKDTLTAVNYFYTETEVNALLAAKANIGANFVLRYSVANALTPADATVYYFGLFPGKPIDTNPTYHQDILPIACKLVAATIVMHNAAGCTQETYSIYLRKNNTTDYLLSSTIFNGVNSGFPYQYYSTGLNNNYAAGDKIEIKIVTPTWTTNPTVYYISVDLYFTTI